MCLLIYDFVPCIENLVSKWTEMSASMFCMLGNAIGSVMGSPQKGKWREGKLKSFAISGQKKVVKILPGNLLWRSGL